MAFNIHVFAHINVQVHDSVHLSLFIIHFPVVAGLLVLVQANRSNEYFMRTAGKLINPIYCTVCVGWMGILYQWGLAAI